MSEQQPWVEIVASRLGPPIMTTSDEVRFNCWRKDCGSGAPDTKYHMYVNPSKGKFFCQRCQRGGSLDFLAKVLGLPKPEGSLTMWERIVHGFLFGPERTYDDEHEVALPDDYEPVFAGTQAHRYLQERFISDTRITHYRIGFGTAELKNRIIIPDYDENDRIVYWVARTYGKHHAKYKNATAPREFQVFNLGRLCSSRAEVPRVVICEGPISAIVAGYDAVATYGKYVTGSQVSRLVKARASEYVIAFDGDAPLEAVSLATRLQRRGLNCSYVQFSRTEDPASVGVREIRRRIRRAKPWNALSAVELML